MKKPVDYKLFFTALFLMIFWMVMISSVSVWGSFGVTSSMADSGYIEEAYNHFYVVRNIIHVILSLFIIWVCVKIPYKYYEKYAPQIFSFSVILLILVLLIGQSYKGATWWLSIPGIPFTIQPTEFLKFALIVFLSSFFKKYRSHLSSFQSGFLPFLVIIWSVGILVWAQPDFWTILVIIPIAFMMFFIAGANFTHVFAMIFLWCFLAVSVYIAWDYDPKTGKNLNTLWYITQRIDNFMSDNQEAIENKTINYQTEQALIAIGSGWILGLGFGNSVQKFGYLPEVQWDFIFSVIAEEWGFLGILFVLSLYLHIAYRWCMIYIHSKDTFAKYASFGITAWILLQAYINIWVNLNIVPLTGITLPFLSYWWSSLLSLCLGLALLLSISRDIEEERHFYKKRWNIFSLRKSLWTSLQRCSSIMK